MMSRKTEEVFWDRYVAKLWKSCGDREVIKKKKSLFPLWRNSVFSSTTSHRRSPFEQNSPKPPPGLVGWVPAKSFQGRGPLCPRCPSDPSTKPPQPQEALGRGCQLHAKPSPRGKKKRWVRGKQPLLPQPPPPCSPTDEGDEQPTSPSLSAPRRAAALLLCLLLEEVFDIFGTGS